MNDVLVPKDVFKPPNETAGWASEKSGLQLLEIVFKARQEYVGGK